MNTRLSSWVRQSRHRAKKYKCINRLNLADITGLLKTFDGKCAYCDVEAITIDQAFPLADGAPNVLANCLPCCDKCKQAKRNLDLLTFHSNGYLDQKKLVSLIEEMLNRDGGQELRDHMRRITGMLTDAEQ